MAQFVYKAKIGPLDISSGTIEADNIAQAVAKLTSSGKVPIDVRLYEKLDRKADLQYSSIKVPATVLYQFTRQLADLLEAGVPLARCMELLSHQRQFPLMAGITESMKAVLEQGGSLSSALVQYPYVFSSLYVHTVKAAEASGQLALIFDRLSQFLESDIQMQSKVKASLLYPVIILGVGVLTLFVLLSFVLPRLTSMFEDFGAQLPLVTRIVIAISQIFAGFWWLMVLAGVGLVVAVRVYLQKPKGRQALDQFVLRVPLLKSYIENTQISRFARTLGMLLESGVPIVTALEAVTWVVDNRILQQEIREMAMKVKSGMSLTQAIGSNDLFPEMAVDLIAVGQESGHLEKGLYKLAANCDRSSQSLAQTFVTVLGPAVLVVVVAMVGFMVVAMLLPMFQMNMIIS